MQHHMQSQIVLWAGEWTLRRVAGLRGALSDSNVLHGVPVAVDAGWLRLHDLVCPAAARGALCAQATLGREALLQALGAWVLWLLHHIFFAPLQCNILHLNG